MATTTTLGDDVITGTGAADELFGDTAGTLSDAARGGKDRIDGGGDDTLTGGSGRDNPIGDAFLMVDSARGGDDLLTGGSGEDQLSGDAYLMRDNARGGDDRLDGGSGDGNLIGDNTYTMGDRARGGGDQLRGGSGNDTLIGDASELADSARGGDDRLDGGPGDDTLYGDAVLVGSDARTGEDTFVFAGAFGDDRILDFRQGEDLLEFAVPGVAGIDDLTVSQSAGDTLIAVEGLGSVTLVGFGGTLGGADIVFA